MSFIYALFNVGEIEGFETIFLVRLIKNMPQSERFISEDYFLELSEHKNIAKRQIRRIEWIQNKFEAQFIQFWHRLHPFVKC